MVHVGLDAPGEEEAWSRFGAFVCSGVERGAWPRTTDNRLSISNHNLGAAEAVMVAWGRWALIGFLSIR